MNDLISALNDLVNGLLAALQSGINWFNGLFNIDPKLIHDCTAISSCSTTRAIVLSLMALRLVEKA